MMKLPALRAAQSWTGSTICFKGLLYRPDHARAEPRNDQKKRLGHVLKPNKILVRPMSRNRQNPAFSRTRPSFTSRTGGLWKVLRTKTIEKHIESRNRCVGGLGISSGRSSRPHCEASHVISRLEEAESGY